MLYNYQNNKHMETNPFDVSLHEKCHELGGFSHVATLDDGGYPSASLFVEKRQAEQFIQFMRQRLPAGRTITWDDGSDQPIKRNIRIRDVGEYHWLVWHPMCQVV